MNFELPVAFGLIIPFIIGVGVTLRERTGRTPKALATAGIRLLVVAAIAAALARPYTIDKAPSQGAVALVDISSSMTEDQGTKLLARARDLADHIGAPLTVIPFAKNSAQSSQNLSSYPSLRSKGASYDPSATNIEGALTSSQHARASLAFLLSDGYESSGHALAALGRGATPRIFPLTVDGPRDPEGITISQLFAPQIVKSQIGRAHV